MLGSPRTTGRVWSQSPPPPMCARMNRTDGCRTASAAQLHRVRRLLAGIVAAPVLPDVVQHRHAALRREGADRIEQRIVGATARGQLDADHAGVEAAADLRQRVVGVVRIHGDVAADPVGMLPLEPQQVVVAVAQILGRGEVGGRGQPPAPQNRGDVDRDPDALARAEPAGVALAPVGARRAVVEEVRVDVDQHVVNLRGAADERRWPHQLLTEASASSRISSARSTAASSCASETKL